MKSSFRFVFSWRAWEAIFLSDTLLSPTLRKWFYFYSTSGTPRACDELRIFNLANRVSNVSSIESIFSFRECRSSSEPAGEDLLFCMWFLYLSTPECARLSFEIAFITTCLGLRPFKFPFWKSTLCRLLPNLKEPFFLPTPDSLSRPVELVLTMLTSLGVPSFSSKLRRRDLLCPSKIVEVCLVRWAVFLRIDF